MEIQSLIVIFFFLNGSFDSPSVKWITTEPSAGIKAREVFLLACCSASLCTQRPHTARERTSDLLICIFNAQDLLMNAFFLNYYYCLLLFFRIQTIALHFIPVTGGGHVESVRAPACNHIQERKQHIQSQMRARAHARASAYVNK